MSIKKSRNLYDILGVEPDATEEEIKKAFREKSKDFHPDATGKGDQYDSFVEISTAYSILSDPEKRDKYDKTGYAGEGGQDTKEVAYEIMQMWFKTIIAGGEELLTKNIVEELKDMFLSDIDKCEERIAQLDKRYDVIKQVNEKVQFSGNNVNILGNTVQEELNHTTFLMKQSRYQIEVDNLAIDIIAEHYDYVL